VKMFDMREIVMWIFVAAVLFTQGTRAGMPFIYHFRRMDVYLRRDGRWQAVAGATDPL
jgi:hypothetical protein